MTVVLGIDPGSLITGWGVIRSERSRLTCLGSGCIRVRSKVASHPLQQVFAGLREVVATFSPDEIAVEDVFMNKNVHSALKLGQARGAAIVAGTVENLPVFEYATRYIKQAVVGYGAAEKDQVERMVRLILKVSDPLTPDAADALAVAICHANLKPKQEAS